MSDADADNELAQFARSRVGRTLGRKYTLDALLGLGGMAAVYAATHRNGRQVALKVLHPTLALHSDIRKRFLLEGHAANAVKHRGVVAILDDDVGEDGTAFLVMELLNGQSVEELWQRYGGRVPAKIALAIGAELCDVLAVAHDKQIVHRDLKPANLFLTVDGQVKVLDFGLARLRDTALGMKTTGLGTVFGTPAFLPPEQAAGEVSSIDVRTDIWAVGATLFTLLSGKTVHEGESPQKLVVRAATTAPRSLQSVFPDAAPEIVALVDRALSFDREERFANGAEMRDALRNVSDALFGDTKDLLVGLTRPSLAIRAARPVAMANTGGPIELVGSRTTEPLSSNTRARAGLPLAPGSAIGRVLERRGLRRAAIFGAVAAGVAFAVFRLIPDRVVEVPAVKEAPSVASRKDTADLAGSALPAANTGVPSAAPSPSVDSAGTATSIAARPTTPPPTVTSPKVRPVQTAPSAAKPAPDCREPSYVLPSGKRIWKPECL
jgi:serine/threonine-protein kinase